MADQTTNVLFLCMKNSVRSIMAEALLQCRGAGRFRAFSAGFMPRGLVHSLTLKVLREQDFDVTGLRSKSWEEFANPDSPTLDLVITVCNRAANETCPVWPGEPPVVHWGIENPDVSGLPDDLLWGRFRSAWSDLEERIDALIALPVNQFDADTLRRQTELIGRQLPDSESAVHAE